MKFNNLMNVFTIFGNFLVFDDDVQPLLNKVYADCDISTAHEQNPANPSGKRMIINDPKSHIIITLRPQKIDVQVPAIPEAQKDVAIKRVLDIFKSLSTVLEDPDITRVAAVSHFFVFDDNGDNIKKLGQVIPFIDSSLSATEINFRTNTPSVLGTELINIVTNVNQAKIRENQGPDRNSLMVIYDINTNHQNQTPRFNCNDLENLFNQMVNVSFTKIKLFENIL